MATTPATTSEIQDRIRQRDAVEQAKREGKPIPAMAEPAKPEPPATNRQEKRAMNRLREEIGYLRGQLDSLRGQQKPPEAHVAAPAEEDPKPQRKDFASEGEYLEKLAEWSGRTSAKKETATASASAEELANTRREIDKAQERLQQDQKLIPDFDKIREEAESDPDRPQWRMEDHPYLTMRLAKSDMLAMFQYHFWQHPEDLQKLLDLSPDAKSKNPDFTAQERAIARLEFRLEQDFEKLKKGAERDPEKPEQKPASAAPAERRYRPSEENSPRGGTAGIRGKIEPLTPDGKLNPEWEAMRNERSKR